MSYSEQLDRSKEAIDWLEGFFATNPDAVVSITMAQNEDGTWSSVPIPDFVADGSIAPSAFIKGCVGYMQTKDHMAGTEENEFSLSVASSGNMNSVKVWRAKGARKPDAFAGTVLEQMQRKQSQDPR